MIFSRCSKIPGSFRNQKPSSLLPGYPPNRIRPAESRGVERRQTFRAGIPRRGGGISISDRFPLISLRPRSISVRGKEDISDSCQADPSLRPFRSPTPPPPTLPPATSFYLTLSIRSDPSNRGKTMPDGLIFPAFSRFLPIPIRFIFHVSLGKQDFDRTLSSVPRFFYTVRFRGTILRVGPPRVRDFANPEASAIVDSSIFQLLDCIINFPNGEINPKTVSRGRF